ncbi:MAG TPA: FlgD immunoglobulin-like domain containing protein [Candidatus Eisenbacteria bacterium]|nr:FlgD immunoglobulin-like domain containing protein [Candidatus Eisenbacteria bacterium]
MRPRIATVLIALILLAPATSFGGLRNYVQNFEGLVQTDPQALSADGWVVYGNIFTPAFAYMYGYGPFPAPNGPAAFSAIDTGQGGPDQGAQQLSVFSDYNSPEHANGNWVESNVYREMTVTAADVGHTYVFEFDAKLGNLVPPSTALAFIKTLNPAAGYALTNFLTANMTSIDATWTHHSISIAIDASLPGQLLQIGFANTTTGYISAGVFYDNVVFHDATTTAVETSASRLPAALSASVSPNPLNPGGLLSFRTSSAGSVSAAMFDLNGRLVRTLLDGAALPAGTHTVAIDGRDRNGATLPSGVYFYRVTSGDEVVRGKVSILK